MSTNDNKNELTRRRNILAAHIGESVQIKREHLSQRERKLCPIVGVLIDVKRTRANIRFSEPPPAPDPWLCLPAPPREPVVFGLTGDWLLPIDWILLPGNYEPAPEQMELFCEVVQ